MNAYTPIAADHSTSIIPGWTLDKRARVILDSFAAHPIQQTTNFDTYVITRDEWSRYEGYRVDCLNAIYAEYWNAANKTQAGGDYTIFDAFMAQMDPQEAIHAAHNPREDEPSLWDILMAETVHALRPPLVSRQVFA